MMKRRQARSALSKGKRAPASAAMPRAEAHFVQPMAASPVRSLPPPNVDNWDHRRWILEPKLDGWRAQILIRQGAVQIRSRNNRDLTPTFPTVAVAAARVNADEATLDGEIVGLDPKGRVSFEALQHGGGPVQFYAFDILFRDGADLMSMPIEHRRVQCAEVIGDAGLGMTVELPGPPATALALAKQFGFMEGLVAKLRGSPYRPPLRPTDRSPAWLKWRTLRRQEFVIGGFQPEGEHIYELIVGYYDDDQRLRFAAKVKDGFVAHNRRTLFRSLQPLLVTECPFVDLPTAERGASQWGGGVSAADMKKMRWARPKLVAEIGFLEWTDAGRLRQATYVGLRHDKSAEAVRRE
jgi:DNA ligase D-like protein (predicted ligase)